MLGNVGLGNVGRTSAGLSSVSLSGVCLSPESMLVTAFWFSKEEDKVIRERKFHNPAVVDSSTAEVSVPH